MWRKRLNRTLLSGNGKKNTNQTRVLVQLQRLDVCGLETLILKIENISVTLSIPKKVSFVHIGPVLVSHNSGAD